MRCSKLKTAKIDRKQLVERHHPSVAKVDPLSPLSVGNGDFAFTADITGLQTFPTHYGVPLGTQSNWGWHSTGKSDRFSLDDLQMQTLDTYGRGVQYPLYPGNRGEVYHWLRQNPHRIQLGQLAFYLLKENGEQATIADVREVEQELNLWEGCLYSHFKLEGQEVQVVTVCHPEKDEIGVKVTSPLIVREQLGIVLRFPSPPLGSQKWKETIDLNWNECDRHQTVWIKRSGNAASFKRIMDEDEYEVAWGWSEGRLVQTGAHEYTLNPGPCHELTFTVSFALRQPELGCFHEVREASKRHWECFWSTGGAVDFSMSSDRRAVELERRVILSQYLTAIHCGGSLPPQETGFMYSSWFGKFHLEMHWWHAAHFPLWGRGHILEKSLQWYLSILPVAKKLAASQGYEGARWPKMVGPNGRQSPSEIAPVLIWQQPHPIVLAELCYQSNMKKETLRRWKELVFETAEFMASFAVWEQSQNRYVLGPPLIPAQECHNPQESKNPTFELEYWAFGLELAVKWKKRLGEAVPSEWIKVAKAIAHPPQRNGVYLAHENCPLTFEKYNRDHPSMVGAFGMLPGERIDLDVMKRTLSRVHREWRWETAWGWDFPMCAMTVARLGERQQAVDFLLMETPKNTYLPNGHNYQGKHLTAYLPGNGGLLTAVAMMASGWRGSTTDDAPGFPDDGSWVVQWENLQPFL